MFMSAFKRLFKVVIPAFFRRMLYGEVGVYVVLGSSGGHEDPTPITVVTKYREAIQAVARAQYFDSFPYYAAYCLDHHEPIGFGESSWTRYAQAHPIALRVYTVQYVRYAQDYLASVMRQLSGAEPLYLPYEAPAEALRYFGQVRQEHDGKICLSPRTEMVSEYDTTYCATVKALVAAAVARTKETVNSKDG